MIWIRPIELLENLKEVVSSYNRLLRDGEKSSCLGTDELCFAVYKISADAPNFNQQDAILKELNNIKVIVSFDTPKNIKKRSYPLVWILTHEVNEYVVYFQLKTSFDAFVRKLEIVKFSVNYLDKVFSSFDE